MSFWFALKAGSTVTLAIIRIFSCRPELEELCACHLEERQKQIVLALLILEETNLYNPDVIRAQIRKWAVVSLSRVDVRTFYGSHNKELQDPLVTRKRQLNRSLNSPAYITRLVAAHAVETWATSRWTP